MQQRYLKMFSCNDQKTKIHVFDKTTNTIRYDQPIKRIACEGGFYDIDFTKYLKYIEKSQYTINSQALSLLMTLGNSFTDTFLSNTVEPLYEAIDFFITQYKQNSLPINSHVEFIATGENRMQFANYLTFQFLRTTAFRKYFLELINQDSPEFLDPQEIENSDLIKLIHSKYLFQADMVNKITETIFFGLWMFGKSPSNLTFYTSDNPVGIVTDISKFSGIFSNVLQISYPILPELILLIMPPNKVEYEEFANKIVEVKVEAVNYFNFQRVMTADRFVCCSKKQLDEAKVFHENSSHLSRMEKNLKLYKM